MLCGADDVLVQWAPRKVPGYLDELVIVAWSGRLGTALSLSHFLYLAWLLQCKLGRNHMSQVTRPRDYFSLVVIPPMLLYTRMVEPLKDQGVSKGEDNGGPLGSKPRCSVVTFGNDSAYHLHGCACSVFLILRASVSDFHISRVHVSFDIKEDITWAHRREIRSLHAL